MSQTDIEGSRSGGAHAMPGRGPMAEREAAPSTAAIGGHPVHPMLVPFPIAFLTGAAASDMAALATGDAFWARTARVCLWAGLAAGLAAATAGATDFATIARARRLKEGRLHAAGNAAALGLTIWNVLSRHGGESRVPRGKAMLSVGVAALLGLTGWYGAEMSYRHRIGMTAKRR